MAPVTVWRVEVTVRKIPNGLLACAVIAAAMGLIGQTAPSGSSITMKKQVLHDDGLGMDAYSVLVPEGWKLQGAIDWKPALPTPWVDISVANSAAHEAWRQLPRIGYMAGIRESQEAAYPAQRQRIEDAVRRGEHDPERL